ncbi:hypothetical protein ECC02_004309 [Trypanosoma cruzi]|nr:hypothetical protein ECC02_004309 [Trypanosoma cruzi]
MKVLLAAKRKYNPQLLTTNRLEQHQLATVPFFYFFLSLPFLLRLEERKERNPGGSFTMSRVYIAGPAVFNEDMGGTYYDRVRTALGMHGVVPLIPVDNMVSGAGEIRAKNLEMIRHCDAVIADLSPFRSHEPDCGTAFEVGYAAALGKTVLTFTSDRRSMREKYGGAFDASGRTVEDFGLPFNLMLCDGTEVFDSFDAAFHHFLRQRSEWRGCDCSGGVRS